MDEKYKSDKYYLREILEELRKINSGGMRVVNIIVHPASGLSEEEIVKAAKDQLHWELQKPHRD